MLFTMVTVSMKEMMPCVSSSNYPVYFPILNRSYIYNISPIFIYIYLLYIYISICISRKYILSIYFYIFLYIFIYI